MRQNDWETINTIENLIAYYRQRELTDYEVITKIASLLASKGYVDIKNPPLPLEGNPTNHPSSLEGSKPTLITNEYGLKAYQKLKSMKNPKK